MAEDAVERAARLHAASSAPLVEPQDARHHDEEEMPRVALTRRRVIAFALFVLLSIAFLYFVLPQIGGVRDAYERVSDGDNAWLAAALAFELAWIASYVALFHGIHVPPGSPLTHRDSYLITMAGLAATRLFAAGGAGGVALTAWALRRSGMERREVAERMIAFLVVLYGVYVVAMFLCGIGLRVGILPGEAPFGLTVVPAAFAGIAIMIALLIALLPTDLQRRVDDAIGRGGWLARLASKAATLPASMSAGVRHSIDHVRARDPAILGSIGYWAFNIAVLWASFRAFGESPSWAVLVMGFLVGMLGNLLPLPGGVGGVDGGMIGAFIGFGVDDGLAVVAVLTYRAFAFWLPTIPGAIAFFQLRRTVTRWREEREADPGHGAAAVAQA